MSRPLGRYLSCDPELAVQKEALRSAVSSISPIPEFCRYRYVKTDDELPTIGILLYHRKHPIFIVGNDLSFIDPPDNHMMQRARRIESWTSRHASTGWLYRRKLTLHCGHCKFMISGLSRPPLIALNVFWLGEGGV